MPVPLAATTAVEVSLEGRNQTLVAVVLAISLLALVVAAIFRRQVLAAPRAPPRCGDRPGRPGGRVART